MGPSRGGSAAEDLILTGSKLLKFATWGVLAPLAVAFLVSLRTGGLERAFLIGFCLAPTAITYHFA